jgi:hypothetical protein
MPSSFIENLRGSYRLTPVKRSPPERAGGFRPSGVTDQGTKADEPSWLSDSRKLIPGEALAGFLSLQPISKLAQKPGNVSVVLALAFLLVTILLRWIGTQDPTATDPKKTVEFPAVGISALSFISLVYATGGQIFWHSPVPDQQLYGQILAAVLGILGPVVYRKLV